MADMQLLTFNIEGKAAAGKRKAEKWDK